MTSKLVLFELEFEIEIYPTYFDLLFFELNKKLMNLINFQVELNLPIKLSNHKNIEKKCAISADKLLFSFVLLRIV